MKCFSLVVCEHRYYCRFFIYPIFWLEASPENKTLMQAQGIQGMTTNNATNIVLVHGAWADGSSWGKVIPILEKAGHRVIAVQTSPFSG